jgi:flagellin-like protein
MKKGLRNRKAVSPVIAALLLIAISVAAALITYSWVMTMIEGQGSQAQTTIRFEEVSFSQGTGGGDIVQRALVRNIRQCYYF